MNDATLPSSMQKPKPGIPSLPHAQAKPMIKLVGRMLKARMGRKGGKGFVANSDIHIKHKKVKFW